MAKRLEDVEKSMKRSNDKKLKVEHELSLKVCEIDFLIQWHIFLFIYFYSWYTDLSCFKCLAYLQAAYVGVNKFSELL